MKKTTGEMFPFFILAGVVFLVFSPCLFAGFLNYDDLMYVVKNPLLSFKDMGDVLVLFMHVDVLSGIYIPLTNLSFGVEHSIWGWNPFVFHFNNIFLHVITAGLVLVLGRRLGISVKAAFVAALVFALHPMRVESVAWIIERKDLLFAVFYLGALIAYLDYVRSGRFGWYVAALVCAILSVLSKPMALSLPLILFLIDWMIGRRLSMRMFWDKAPFMLALWPVAMISAILAVRQVPWSPGEMFLITIYSCWFYVAEFFCPLGRSLIVLTPQPVAWAHPAYAGALGGLLALSAAGWIFRKNKWVVFAGAFYVLSIFIVLQIGKYSGAGVADRYMYVPCVGFVLLVGAAWDRLFFREGFNNSRRAWLGWLAASVLCAALAVITFERCLPWHDSFTFWSEVVRRNPRDANAYNNRGAEFVREPDMCRKHGLRAPVCDELARRDFQRALELAPSDQDVWHNLSVVLRRLGRNAEAREAEHRAKQLGWRAP